MKYLITAFGGGHTSLALACMEKISDENFFLILKNDEMTRSRMDALGLKYFEVIEPRRLGESLLNPIVLFRFLMNAFQSVKILISEKPDVVISTGPNPSIPISLIAKLLRKKLINVEAVDRIIKPSLTARILSLFADETWVHWEKQKGWFRNARLVGPLFFEQKSGIKVDLTHPIIAVFTGRKRYEDLLDAISFVDKEIKCSWIIQTAGGSIRVENEALVRDFFMGISDLIRQADFVIATGGLTAFEALAKGKPLILYPRKDTLEDHQVKQALYLSAKNRCWYVEDKKELKRILIQILKNRSEDRNSHRNLIGIN